MNGDRRIDIGTKRQKLSVETSNSLTADVTEIKSEIDETNLYNQSNYSACSSSNRSTPENRRDLGLPGRFKEKHSVTNEQLFDAVNKLSCQNEGLMMFCQTMLSNQNKLLQNMNEINCKMSKLEKQNEILLGRTSMATSVLKQTTDIVAQIHNVVQDCVGGEVIYQTDDQNIVDETREENFPDNVSNTLDARNESPNDVDEDSSNFFDMLNSNGLNNWSTSTDDQHDQKEVVDVNPENPTQMFVGGNKKLKMSIADYNDIIQSKLPSTVVIRLMKRLIDKPLLARSCYRGLDKNGMRKHALNNDPTMLSILEQVRKQFPDFILNATVKKAITNCCLEASKSIYSNY